VSYEEEDTCVSYEEEDTCARLCVLMSLFCVVVSLVYVCVWGGGLSYMREFCLWFCVDSGFVREV